MKKSKLKYLMLAYVVIWIIAIVLIDRWIWNTAEEYQNKYDTAKALSVPELFMDKFISEVNEDTFAGWLCEEGYSVSELAVSDEYNKYYSNIINGESITYEAGEEKNTYYIYAGEIVIGKVKIANDNTYDEFGFSGWEVKNIDVISYVGEKLEKTIVAEAGYDIYVNGKKLSDDYVIKVKETPMQAYMTGITGENYSIKIYHINNFLVEPQIQALDKAGNNIKNTSEEYDMLQFVSTKAAAMDDVLKKRVSETFHTYFEHLNKLNTYDDMKKYLVSGTDAYELIKNAQKSLTWVVPVKQLIIEEERIDNYTVYNDSYFSCKVYMNVRKNYGYAVKNEYFDATVLFRKINGIWYWDTFILN